MNTKEAKKRIEKLKKVIGRYRYMYHVLDKQEISDEAHDSLKRELSELEKQFPGFVTQDSPTQRVGGEPLDKFEKAEHRVPMVVLHEKQMKYEDSYVILRLKDFKEIDNEQQERVSDGAGKG